MVRNEITPVWNEDNGGARRGFDEGGEFCRDLFAEERGREVVDFAALDEGVGGVDEGTGLCVAPFETAELVSLAVGAGKGGKKERREDARESPHPVSPPSPSPPTPAKARTRGRNRP